MYKFICFAAVIILAACQPKSSEETSSEVSATPAPAEIGNPDLIEIGKAGLAAMNSGDMDAFIANYADDARYYWNYGDSLIGKEAIHEYWKKRRGEVITSIEFANQIWLPVKVNSPQSEVQQSGDWVLGWYQVSTTYNTGKSMTQWIHADHHFNADGKIDQTIMYLDRASINAAMTK